MKRALFVDQYGELGGGQRVLLEAARTSLEAGWKPTLLFPHGGGLERAARRDLGKAAETRHCRELRLTTGSKNLGDALRLAAYTIYFLRFAPLFAQSDLIYVNGGRLYLPSWLLCMLFRSPAIYHLHIDHSPLEKGVLRALLATETTRHLVVASGFLHQRLLEFDGAFLEQRVRVVENALPRDFAGLPFEDRFAGSPLTRVALLGRLAPEKGQDILLELAPSHPGLEIFIIGGSDFADSAYATRLRRQAPVNVRFLGRVDDPARTLSENRIQAVVVPSRWQEPFGLVAIESMACSCLTLVRRSGGLGRIAERTGALVFHEDRELIELLRRLNSSAPEDLTRIARRQHERTQAEYHPRRFADALRPLLTVD